MKNITQTILFVEDDPLVMTVYRSRLEREGFHAELAENGLTAIEKLSQIKPQMVILDLMLPMLDGLDVLKFIRDDEELKTTPVLVLSNAFLSDMATKAMKAGANKGMLKTDCTPSKLIEAIRELVGNSPETDRPVAAPNPSKDIASSKIDEASLKHTREALLKDGQSVVAKIREHCVSFVKTAGTPENAEHLNQFYQQVRFLGTRATLSECTKVAQLTGALEAMLFEILLKSATPSPSALHTAAQAVDCLGRLFKNGETQFAQVLKVKVLAVDDDPICNFAVVGALKRINFEAVGEQDPLVALEKAQKDQFDIVLLDINMPALNGFEVCKKLRQFPAYKSTPVIFVTSNGEFQNRAQSVLSGGNDLITKPISPLELALKATMHLVEPKDVTNRSQGDAKLQPVIPSAESVPAKANDPNQPRLVEQAEVKEPVRVDRAPEIKCAPREIKPPQPSRNICEALPANHVNSPINGKNHKLLMKNENENGQSFDKFAADVSRIIFGDNVPEMNSRLVRITLERYNVPEVLAARRGAESAEANKSFDVVVREVARIIFGDQVSDMHVRLTRIALERYDGGTTASNGVPAEQGQGVVINL